MLSSLLINSPTRGTIDTQIKTKCRRRSSLERRLTFRFGFNTSSTSGSSSVIQPSTSRTVKSFWDGILVRVSTSAMTAKLLKANGEVVHRSSYLPLTRISRLPMKRSQARPRSKNVTDSTSSSTNAMDLRWNPQTLARLKTSKLHRPTCTKTMTVSSTSPCLTLTILHLRQGTNRSEPK